MIARYKKDTDSQASIACVLFCKKIVTVQKPSGSLIVIVQNRESKNLFYSDLLLLCG